MGKIIVLLPVLLCSLQLLANNYPIPANGSVYGLVGIMGGYKGYTSTFNYTSDIVINGLTYQVWNGGSTITRNDSNKVYLRENDTDILMYDFNLVKGDSMVIEGHTFRVSEADTMIMKNGQHRKYVSLECALWVADDYKRNYKFTWVEGIGDLVYGFNNVGLDFETYTLFCYCDSSGLVYQRQNGITCDNVDSIGLAAPEYKPSDINICQQGKMLHLKTDKPFKEARIYDITGREITRTKEDEILLDDFPQGVYVVYVLFKDGTAFPYKVVLR